MNFFFDRNWSPHIVAALAALNRPNGHEIAHHDRDFAANTPDLEWIAKLGEDGDWAIMTKDRLTRQPAEREALRRTGLLVFIFAKPWSDHRFWDQAWMLVRWWPTILQASKILHEVPFRFRGGGKLRQIKL